MSYDVIDRILYRLEAERDQQAHALHELERVARAMLAALRETAGLLRELQDGGAENPELDLCLSAIAAAERAGIRAKS